MGQHQQDRDDRDDRVASNHNKVPSRASKNTTVIPISDLETEDMLPTVLRNRISIQD